MSRPKPESRMMVGLSRERIPCKLRSFSLLLTFSSLGCTYLVTYRGVVNRNNTHSISANLNWVISLRVTLGQQFSTFVIEIDVCYNRRGYPSKIRKFP